MCEWMHLKWVSEQKCKRHPEKWQSGWALDAILNGLSQLSRTTTMYLEEQYFRLLPGSFPNLQEANPLALWYSWVTRTKIYIPFCYPRPSGATLSSCIPLTTMLKLCPTPVSHDMLLFLIPAWQISLFFPLFISCQGILKALPLSAMPSPCLLESSFTS